MQETDPKKVKEVLEKYKEEPMASWKGANPQPKKKEENDKNKLHE